MASALSRLRSRADPAEALAPRIRALEAAAQLCDGRADEAAVSAAARLVAQADRRLAFSGAATVVALAGATGSGKSSLFNALTRSEVAVVGIRRPTTSKALAGVWGSEPTEELLDWLDIPRRHALEPSSEQGPVDGSGSELDGLVLLDLPDHDSTEVAHRLEVDRLVELVDAMIWVLDPQKYADAALHDRYLKPLAQHAGVMTVVLNQIDRLAPDAREACVRDLVRLLSSEGLTGVDVLPVSAETGEGVERLQARLTQLVREKRAAAQRLAADVVVAADRLSVVSGVSPAPDIGKGEVDRMNAALGKAAGVVVVSEAVGKAWRHRGGLATGWPVLAWVAKFKPDPLRRLHLDRIPGGRKKAAIEAGAMEADPPGRTSLPATTGIQRAGVDAAVRAFADQASSGLSRGWADAIKAAARSETAVLPDQLDGAIAGTDLDLDRHRGWWQLVRVLQWVFVVAVLAGLGWLASAFVLAFMQLPPLPKVTWWGLPAPTVLLVGGVLAGLLTAGLARIGVVVGARRRERAASKALRRSIAGVTRELVVAPVKVELDRYEQARAALERARA
jgi:GTP-binding protein EngB required for normal cell division